MQVDVNVMGQLAGASFSLARQKLLWYMDWLNEQCSWQIVKAQWFALHTWLPCLNVRQEGCYCETDDMYADLGNW